MMRLQVYVPFVIYFSFVPLFSSVVQSEYIDKIKSYSINHAFVSRPESKQMHEDLSICLILLQKVYTSADKDYPFYKAYEFLLRVIFHLYDQLNLDFGNNDTFLLLQQRIATLKKMCMNDKNILTTLKTRLHITRFIPIPVSLGALGSSVGDVLKIVTVIITIVLVYKSLRHFFLSEREEKINELKKKLGVTREGFNNVDKSLGEKSFLDFLQKDKTIEFRIKKLTEERGRVEVLMANLQEKIAELKSSMKIELMNQLTNFENFFKEKKSDQSFDSIMAANLTRLAKVEESWNKERGEQEDTYNRHNNLLEKYCAEVEIFRKKEAMEIDKKQKSFKKIAENLQNFKEKLIQLPGGQVLITTCDRLLKEIKYLEDYFNEKIYHTIIEATPLQIKHLESPKKIIETSIAEGIEEGMEE